MPSTDGAIGLGLSTMTILKGSGHRSQKFDAKRVVHPCGVTLPSAPCAHKSHTGCKQIETAHGRPKHAQHGKLLGMVGLGRLTTLEVAGRALLPRNTHGWLSHSSQPCVRMRALWE